MKNATQSQTMWRSRAKETKNPDQMLEKSAMILQQTSKGVEEIDRLRPLATVEESKWHFMGQTFSFPSLIQQMVSCPCATSVLVVVMGHKQIAVSVGYRNKPTCGQWGVWDDNQHQTNTLFPTDGDGVEQTFLSLSFSLLLFLFCLFVSLRLFQKAGSPLPHWGSLA